LRGEPDWIVMKCLEKNRTRRYETVNALAMDINRYLNHEPVLSREPTTLYRLKKLIDRNRLAFGASFALAACLFFGSIAIALLGLHAIRSERQAQMEARKSAEISEFIKSIYSYVDSQVELQLKGEEETQLIREVLKETMDLAAERLSDVSSEAVVELYDILGAVYFKIREYAAAESMFRLELEAIEALSEPDYAHSVMAMNHLGAALGRQGYLEEAELNIREALRLQREELDASDQEVARSLVNLSVVQVKKAASSLSSNENREIQLQAAVESIEEALRLQRESLGNEHEEIAASLNGFQVAHMDEIQSPVYFAAVIIVQTQIQGLFYHAQCLVPHPSSAIHIYQDRCGCIIQRIGAVYFLQLMLGFGQTTLAKIVRSQHSFDRIEVRI